MNKEFAKKWVDALRSGKYEQGHGALCKNNKYCCLGVACDVLGIVKSEKPNEIGEYLFDGNANYLPEKAEDVIGISGAGSLSFKCRLSTWDNAALDVLNDAGMSFSEIADVIEYEAGI